MDAAYFREKAATCLRLARGLSWNNPARSALLDLAEDFDRRARGSGFAAGAAASTSREEQGENSG
jgi:hypothetical protein